MLTLEQVKAKSAKRLDGSGAAMPGVNIMITQGLRTIAEQDALYAQGRTKPGSIVTNARGGYSYHNYGLATDFALLLLERLQCILGHEA